MNVCIDYENMQATVETEEFSYLFEIVVEQINDIDYINGAHRYNKFIAAKFIEAYDEDGRTYYAIGTNSQVEEIKKEVERYVY